MNIDEAKIINLSDDEIEEIKKRTSEIEEIKEQARRRGRNSSSDDDVTSPYKDDMGFIHVDVANAVMEAFAKTKGTDKGIYVEDVIDILRNKGWDEEKIKLALATFDQNAISSRSTIPNPDENSGEADNMFYSHNAPQNERLNKLTRSLTVAPNLIFRPKKGNASEMERVGEIKDGELTITLREYKGTIRTNKTSTVILLHCLLISAMRDGNLNKTRVYLSVKEYMKLRGISDWANAYEQLTEEATSLAHVEINITSKSGKKENWRNILMVGEEGYGYDNGILEFNFNNHFLAGLLDQYGRPYFMALPNAVLQVNLKRNPWAFWLSWTISLHKHMNAGKDNENKIRVRTLIDACPNYPTRENAGRKIKDRIIEPFERDMNSMKDIFSWEYECGERPAKYEDFMATVVIIKWHHQPQNAIEHKSTKNGERATVKKKRAGQRKGQTDLFDENKAAKTDGSDVLRSE